MKEKIIEFSKQFKVDIVYGSNMKTSVKEVEKIILPEDKENLIDYMKKKGIYESISMINFMSLQSKILKGQLEELKGKVKIGKDYKLNISKRRDIDEE